MTADSPLARFGGPDTQRAALERIGRARGRVGALAGELVELPGRGRDRRPPGEIGRDLDALGDRQRRKVMRTVHPPLADVLGEAWHAWRSAPYTTGWTRRAYRAPDDPRVSAGARAARLRMIARTALAYPQDAAWFAEWVGHVQHGAFWYGELLAVAIDRGDDRVLSILQRLAGGSHDTARFGSHVPIGLLAASRPEGWESVVRLLLAAQRQEGLRQSVLEAIDLAHPDAFRRMLDVVVDEGLARFAATVRAAGVWLGEEFEVRDRPLLEDLLGRMRDHLDDEPTRRAALATGDAADVQLALFATSFRDAIAGGAAAVELLADPDGDRRLAAVRHLVDLQLERHAEAIGTMVVDTDLRVAAVAVAAAPTRRSRPRPQQLLELLDRLEGDVTVPVGIHRPQQATLSPSDVADLVGDVAGPDDVHDVRRALPRMSPDGRSRVARDWARTPGGHRDDLLALAADRSARVRELAFEGLARVTLAPTDAPAVEDLLRRRSGDVRRGAIGLLLGQGDDAVVASAERLLAGTTAQVSAAVELVTQLRDAGRAPAAVDRLATAALADERVTGADRDSLAAPTDGAVEVPPALVVDHAARTPATPPVGGTRPTRDDPDVRRLLTSLDAWLLEHRDIEVTVESWSGVGRQLVGDLRYLRRPTPGTGPAAILEQMPLGELLAPWATRVLEPLPDPAHVALRAAMAIQLVEQVEAHERPRSVHGMVLPDWVASLLARWAPVDVVGELATRHTIASLLPWVVAGHATRDTVTAAMADASGTLAVVAAEPGATALRDVAAALSERRRRWDQRAATPVDWRLTGVLAAVAGLDELLRVRPDLDDETVVAARWRLARWLDEPRGTHDPASGGRLPYPDVETYGRVSRPDDLPDRPPRLRPPLALLLRAHALGAATDADVDEAMLTEWVEADLTRPGWHTRSDGPGALGELTRRSPTGASAEAPVARARAARIRDALVDLEIGRGELPTPTTGLVTQVRSVIGADRTCALLAGLGRETFVRGYSWSGGNTRKDVFSRLVRVSFPGKDEDHEDLAAAVARHGVGERRLVELAMYAPQWAPDVELVLGWDGLTDAVRWVHAHTKSSDWTVDRDVLAEWRRTTHEQTPLAPADLVAGAVDVEWFRRTRATLGDERLDRVLAAGRYASSSGGHKRAQLYAEALRGTAEEADLLTRIEGKRHQDTVRALGLLPLPDDDTRESTVLARYEALMAFDRGRRRFGQQRQASEAEAVRIGLDNLARTAGHRDAQRLRWRMETAAVADLAAGAVEIARDDVTLELSVDDEGSPQLAVTRGTRSLKNVPRTLSKDEEVRALRARARSLREQSTRMRGELETAMVRGDLFGVDEFRALLDHPLLRPMLTRLVVVAGDGALGLPGDDGAGLRDAAGGTRPWSDREVRIAHPVDLLDEGTWSQWQRLLFEERLRQPFKQVFRELYVPTPTEVDEHRRSSRYAGQQVQARQATALFGARGWVVDFADGTAVRTFHDESITALVTTTIAPGTPAEVEDPTVEQVWFVPRDRGGDEAVHRRPLELDAVPRRLFSEVMRDVDLVVSVAHAGGVDPETSASSIEARHAVVRETVELLGLDNVELTETHAMITGQLGSYSVHLGSAQVHRRPGNAVCIIPIGAQHRGRVFLPFVDDDPRTAEIVSKVVLLADDRSIRDPSILAQLT